jgi:hypothetical protein
MDFSTPVDNLVPYWLVNVDKSANSAAAVDKPVNDCVESPVSTGLSTVLITYRDVVHAEEALQKPSKPGIAEPYPTIFSPSVDNLWVGGCC